MLEIAATASVYDLLEVDGHLRADGEQRLDFSLEIYEKDRANNYALT